MKKSTLFYTGFILLLLGAILSSCSSEAEKPEEGSEAYQKAVSDFYISLAAIQANQALLAVEKMDSLARKYPQEAAAWANLAVFSMRQGNLDKAGEQIDKALKRAENNAEILFLAGLLESRRGNVDASIRYLRQAADANPDNIKIAYALAEELQRQDNIANAEEVFSILESILETNPDNLAVLLEMVRTAVKWESHEVLKETISLLSKKADNWPEEVQRQFREIRSTILEGSEENLTFQLAFLRNNLNQLPRFQNDLTAIQISPTQVGFLVTDFTWLPAPSISVAEADTGLVFQRGEDQPDTSAELVRMVALSDNLQVDEVIVDNGSAVINNEQQLKFPGSANSRFGVETIDYDYDFLNDLAFAGSGGFKLYQQQGDSTFSEVTSSTQLPADIRTKSYHGLWSRDIDLDGDLDLVMSPVGESVFVLRNNGDGTFQREDFFNEVESPLNFAWADFDGDADSDAVFLDSDGTVHLYYNERSSKFTKAENIPQQTGVFAIEVSDINNDGNFDLITWTSDGINRFYFDQETAGWETEKILDVPSQMEGKASTASLFSADLDNNGANDIAISTPRQSGYWLNNKNMQVDSTFRSLPANIWDIADINTDTRLDIVSISDDGIIQRNINTGSKNYIARIIRPRASGPAGDRRINSFGIGGAIEIRSGLLYQKQLINQPRVHLGLGTYDEAKMLRIIWPNGSSQTEFAELGYGSKIFNEQVLKGSCPWVFTYNGEEMEFVTDFLWRTGLGIRINAQGEANVIHSIDWVKVDGDQLEPRDGKYDVRITADLWETHFFDHVSLKAIDHPSDTEVFVDERFSFPPREPQLHVVSEPKPVAKAVDQDGRDVTGKVRTDDQQFVDSFALTKYQGLAEEHYVEIHLPEDVPFDEEVRLIASGWIYPTDTSINIALSQGSQPAPRPLRLEVPDGNGGWKVVRENIGFPAGKSKTMVIDLSGVFEPGTKPRIRLSTSMEIYWNRMQWAVAQPKSSIEQKDIEFSTATLRYRGYSEVKRPSRFIPERPDYQQLNGTTPMWYDLEGFYTRFGKVNELVKGIDDRYVIMNAGDELVFEFPAASSPAEGMSRDFVLVGDGWVKDGDYNTGFSKTVLPLPYHGMEDYSEEPGRLQDDPVYQKHKKDWIEYHIRYITPRAFRTALKFEK